MKDKFQKTIDELDKDYFNNYWEMEKVLVSQLKKKGQEYYIKNKSYLPFLGRFESTLRAGCEICEKIGYNKGNLLMEYLHLNDIKNVKIQLKNLKDNPKYFIYKDYHKYQDSGKVLKSKLVSIKYDKRVERFTNWVFDKTDDIDKFLIQEWDGMLPPVIRVIFMNHNGPGPYNPDLNETYLGVKGMKKRDLSFWTGAIVHETFHLTNSNSIKKRIKFEFDWNMNSFKLLDEGYAQLIQSKFSKETSEKRKPVDYYSMKIIKDDVLNIYDLQDKWAELFTERQEIYIYDLALSLSYFLEDKFGHEKLKRVFFPVDDIKEDSWLEYVENYFGVKMRDLIDEWKLTLINNIDLEPEIESVPTPEICSSCSNYQDKKKETDCFIRRYNRRKNKKFKCSAFIEIKGK